MEHDQNRTIGDRVRDARLAQKMSQQELASRSGVSQQTIAKIEKGLTENSRHLPRVAGALGLNLTELDPTAGSLPAPPDAWRINVGGQSPDHLRYRHDNRGLDPNVIRLYPLSQTPHEQFWWSDTHMGFLRRIEPLWESVGAYGLSIADDRSSPSIGAGDVVLVNPDLPPLPGTDCVFIRKQPDGSKPWVVEVRRLVRGGAEAWTVEQFNPPKIYDLPRSDFADAHRVVAIYRRP